MRPLLLVITVLVYGCASQSPKPYWVPLIEPDGDVDEVLIYPGDIEGRAIICIPLQTPFLVRCMCRLPEGYGYATVNIWDGVAAPPADTAPEWGA